MLGMVLTHHYGPFRATLMQLHGIDDPRDPAYGAQWIAELLENAPNGSPVWKAFGGPRAWSDEVMASMLVWYQLQVVTWQRTEDGSKNQNAPEMPQPPAYAHEARQKDLAVRRRIDRFLQRQARAERGD